MLRAPTRLTIVPSTRVVHTKSFIQLGRARQSATLGKSSRVIVARANNEEEDKPKKMTEAEEKFVEDLKKRGVDARAARDILTAWESAGGKDPQSLRKIFLRQSVTPLFGLLIQLAVDVAASLGAYSAASALSGTNDFPLRYPAEFLFYFLTMYFGIQVVSTLITLGALGFAVGRYSLGAGDFLAAIRIIAAQGASGNALVDGVRSAVDSVKVVNMLNKLRAVLQARLPNMSEADSLEMLAGFLVLSKAETEQGFKAADYDLSDEDASKLAIKFARYDLNEDFVLQQSELAQLLRDLGSDLAADEERQAMRLLDSNRNNKLEFAEFVQWWAKEVDAPRKSQGSSEENSQSDKVAS